MERKDILGQKLDSQLTLEINFKGSEFDNFVDIIMLNKKLGAIDKTIKSTIFALKESRKIREKRDIIDSVQVDIRRNSLDNVVLIHFIAPTVSGIIGGLFVNYITYLINKKKDSNFDKEYSVLNKDVSNLNQILNLISVKDINSKIEIVFDKNKLIISNSENLEIKKNINELKLSLDVEEYNEVFIGRIEKLDMSNNKEDFYFTLDQTDKKIPVSFENTLELAEIKDILFEKIQINSIAKYKNKVLIQLHVIDYKILKRISLKDY